MDLSTLLLHFETSPSARLLRAGNAPYVIAFLHAQFKQASTVAIPHSELLPALTSFQEDLHEQDPDVLRDKAETYLADWCSSDKLWIRRFLESGYDEPLYQLTPHTEEVIEFIDQSLHRDIAFVGTESRLRLVLKTLEQLVVGASDDPAVHLHELKRQKAAIEERINKIESGNEISTYSPTRIREEFNLAVVMLRELERDFRAVEERFREITQDVQQRQLQGMDTRGGILSVALDAEDALRNDDQGISFYEFFRLIQSSRQQQQLRALIQHLGEMQELSGQTEGLQAIRRMMPLLLDEAARVTRTERRLSSTLRRLLDAEAQKERMRVAELMREIRSLAAAMSSHPPRDAVALELEDTLEIQSPVSRSFWTAPQEFDSVDLTESTGNTGLRDDLFRQFAQLHRIDFRAMRSQIADAVARESSVSLRDLLLQRPPQSGVMDVLGYLQIASDDGHRIDEDLPEDVVIRSGLADDREIVITIPRVVFSSKSGDSLPAS